MRDFTGYSDYHSMQVSVNRRRSRRLSFGAAYTDQIATRRSGPSIRSWPTTARGTTTHGQRPPSAHSGDQLHLRGAEPEPQVGQHRCEADARQLAGFGDYVDPERHVANFTYSYSNVPTGALSGTGSINGGGSRPDIVCDPNLPRSERTFERQFNVECIKPPSDQFRLGNSTNDEYLLPGFVNRDISLFKNFPMGRPAASSSASSFTTRSTRTSGRASTETRRSTSPPAH